MAHEPFSLVDFDRLVVVEIFETVGRDNRENLRRIDAHGCFQVLDHPLSGTNLMFVVVDHDRDGMRVSVISLGVVLQRFVGHVSVLSRAEARSCEIRACARPGNGLKFAPQPVLKLYMYRKWTRQDTRWTKRNG